MPYENLQALPQEVQDKLPEAAQNIYSGSRSCEVQLNYRRSPEIFLPEMDFPCDVLA
jgi:hypothetical protein